MPFAAPVANVLAQLSTEPWSLYRVALWSLFCPHQHCCSQPAPTLPQPQQPGILLGEDSLRMSVTTSKAREQQAMFSWLTSERRAAPHCLPLRSRSTDRALRLGHPCEPQQLSATATTVGTETLARTRHGTISMAMTSTEATSVTKAVFCLSLPRPPDWRRTDNVTMTTTLHRHHREEAGLKTRLRSRQGVSTTRASTMKRKQDHHHRNR